MMAGVATQKKVSIRQAGPRGFTVAKARTPKNPKRKGAVVTPAATLAAARVRQAVKRAR